MDSNEHLKVSGGTNQVVKYVGNFQVLGLCAGSAVIKRYKAQIVRIKNSAEKSKDFYGRGPTALNSSVPKTFIKSCRSTANV